MNPPSTATAGEKASPLVFWLGVLPGRILAGISCAFLFAMMILTFVDVAGRYIFNSPIYGAYEIIYLMMPGLIFMALPILCYQEGHVTIDLMDGFIPKKAKRWQALVVNLIATVAVAFIAWRLFVLSSDHALNEDVTDTLYISLAPISMFMAIMSTVAALALLLNVGGYVLNRREPPDTAVLQAVKDAND